MVNLETVEFFSFPSLIEKTNKLTDIRDLVKFKVFLQKNPINNYAELEELLSKCSKDEKYLTPLYDALDIIKKQIKKANDDGRKSQIYLTKGYDHTTLDKKTIELTEQGSLASKLLYNAPTYLPPFGKLMLSDLNVYDTKYLLSHTTTCGTCAFTRQMKQIDNKRAEKLQYCLNLFEEQIIRQFEETNETGVNLFTLQSKEKQELVEAQYLEIIEYIVNSQTEEYAWGLMTDLQKNLLQTSINGTHKSDKERRQKVIEMISNYSTLNELKKGAVKSKVIDRLMIKR